MNAFISKSRSKRGKKQARSGQPLKRSAAPAFPVWLLGFMLWLAFMALIHGGTPVHYTSLAPGQRSPITVVAAADFICEDVAKTELARVQAADAVMPIFSIDYTPYHSAVRFLDSLFDEITDTQKEEAPLEGALTLSTLKQLQDTNLSFTAEELLALAPLNKIDRVRTVLKTALEQVWKRGIIGSEEKETSFSGVAAHAAMTLSDPEKQEAQTVFMTDLLLPREAVASSLRYIERELNELKLDRVLVQSLLTPWITPNLVYDSDATGQAREEAQHSVSPVMLSRRAGHTLVEARERVTPQILEELRAHEMVINQNITRYDRALKIAGNGSLLLIILIVCGGLLHIVTPSIYQKTATVLLWGILALLPVLLAKVLVYLSDTARFFNSALLPFLIPLSLAPMLASILINRSASVVLGLLAAFTTALFLDNNFILFSMGIAVSVVAALSMREVHRRSRVFKAGLWVGLTKTFFALSIALWTQPALPITLAQAGWGLASGLLAAFIALLLLPVFEMLFRITTDIRLLELSDMGHPLLQRLAIEAPGTYHHSLMVANLARAAVQEVGGNALLARVCAYYHDVGKLTKPEFFTENSQFRANPHDDLAPSMSALIIVAHVKEGVSLASQYKLPHPIIDGIQQHHGTSLISFFYHRAQKQLELTLVSSPPSASERPVEEKDYRYPGPKPQTPEMGILLLADSIEAASRSMEKPTPSKIENLVNDIIDEKFQDGQLDESDLHFTQLAQIRKSMIFTLTNMLHGRVPYPGNENRDQQQTDGVPNQSPRDQPLDPMVYGSGTGDG